MKKILIFIISLSISGISAGAMHKHRNKKVLHQDTLIAFFQTMSLTQFNNKPIDSFIAKIPQNYQSMVVLGGSSGSRAGKLAISYNSNVYILVRVTEFTHMDPTNPNKIPPEQRWSTTLMRKEKIYSIRIYNGSTLINHLNEDY